MAGPLVPRSTHPHGDGGIQEGQLLLEALRGFLILINKKGKVLFVTPNIEEYLGIPQVNLNFSLFRVLVELVIMMMVMMTYYMDSRFLPTRKQTVFVTFYSKENLGLAEETDRRTDRTDG